MIFYLALAFGIVTGAWLVLFRLRDANAIYVQTNEIVATVDPSEWLESARIAAINIARDAGRVSADDVWNACPPPAGIDGRKIAAVFDKAEWQIVGRVRSARGRNAAREIAVWTLKETETAS